MRVAGQAAADLAAEPVEVGLAEATLEEGAGVDAGRRVALDEHLVAEAAVGLAAEEVVEADLVEGGGRRVGGQMAADAVEAAVGPGHHHRRVPPDEVADAPLEVLVARVGRLVGGGDRVDVVGHAQRGHVDPELVGSAQDVQQHTAGAGRAASLGEAVEGVDPLLHLAGVRVGELAKEPVRVHPSDRLRRLVPSTSIVAVG